MRVRSAKVRRRVKEIADSLRYTIRTRGVNERLCQRSKRIGRHSSGGQSQGIGFKQPLVKMKSRIGD